MDGSTRLKGSWWCLLRDLQCAVTAYCFLAYVPVKTYLSLMQALSVFTKRVNCRFPNLIYSGTIIGTKCHLWQPKQVTSFSSFNLPKQNTVLLHPIWTNQNPGFLCVRSIWDLFPHSHPFLCSISHCTNSVLPPWAFQPEPEVPASMPLVGGNAFAQPLCFTPQWAAHGCIGKQHLWLLARIIVAYL